MKMRPFGAVLVAAASLVLLASPARADYAVKDGNGAFQTMKSFIVGFIHHPGHVMEGLFGGVPTPVNMTNTGQIDVNCITGCSGGGGGGVVTNAGTFAVQNTASLAAGSNTIGTVNIGTIAGISTAANQATEITAMQALVASIGDTVTATCASPTSTCTTNQILRGLWVAALDTTTKSPVKTADGDQATLGITTGGACATDNGTCTLLQAVMRGDQRLTSLIAALGSPFQAGGSVGISGTLPAFAATPTFNCGTGCSGGSATDNTVTGSLTALNQAATLTGLNGQSSVNLQISAIPAGDAVVVEYSKDSFATVKTASAITPTGISNAAQTATGFYRYLGIAGYPQARARVSTFVSGTVTLSLTTSAGVDGTVVANAIPGAFQVTDNLSGAVTGPTSTLTLPATTTAYSAGQLLASSATAGSVVVPSFSIANSAGGAAIGRLRLSVNDATSTAWPLVKLQVDLWIAAPTFTNGDRGAFLPATGAANHLAAFTCTMGPEYGDGAYAECAPAVGSYVIPKLAAGTTVFWTLQAVTAGGVTGASKVFTLTAETLN